MTMLPLGVIVPTRNSIRLLPDHLAAMRPWLGHVQEVVVVDSHSKDGTLELLKSELHHPNLKFFQHPPGLYQSWNFGISQVRSEFCYVSTVGETITLEGLAHLAELGRAHRCDVVISQPTFVDLNGRPIDAPLWPINDILSSLRASEPVVLEGAALFLFTLLNYRDAILGSSASNLYRTSCLVAHPFPADYGTAGDGGWGLQNCCRIRLAATPQVFSTFREHPKSYAKSEYAVDDAAFKKLQQIERTWREKLAEDPGFAAISRELQIEGILELLHQHYLAQSQLERCRESTLPWIFNPAAWRARNERTRLQADLDKLKTSGLAKLFRERKANC